MTRPPDDARMLGASANGAAWLERRPDAATSAVAQMSEKGSDVRHGDSGWAGWCPHLRPRDRALRRTGVALLHRGMA